MPIDSLFTRREMKDAGRLFREEWVNAYHHPAGHVTYDVPNPMPVPADIPDDWLPAAKPRHAYRIKVTWK